MASEQGQHGTGQKTGCAGRGGKRSRAGRSPPIGVPGRGGGLVASPVRQPPGESLASGPAMARGWINVNGLVDTLPGFHRETYLLVRFVQPHLLFWCVGCASPVSMGQRPELQTLWTQMNYSSPLLMPSSLAKPPRCGMFPASPATAAPSLHKGSCCSDASCIYTPPWWAPAS